MDGGQRRLTVLHLEFEVCKPGLIGVPSHSFGRLGVGGVAVDEEFGGVPDDNFMGSTGALKLLVDVSLSRSRMVSTVVAIKPG
jgi:hypothetical protein